MESLYQFTDEQARTLINLRQHYENWMAAERDFAALPYDLRRKEIGGKAYLYEIYGRDGNGRSLGPWSAQNETIFEDYQATKTALKARLKTTRDVVNETGKVGRALSLPMLASDAGPILREADRRRLLGSRLLVVGTNAMVAYFVEAGGIIRDAPMETMDFDLAWSSTEPEQDRQTVWKMLKAVDPTFTVNTERTFQARNSKSYEVELLVAPSRVSTMAQAEQPRPVPLPEQEWLLMGKPVDQVVICRDASPARIVAPDPRWFALQKLWMSAQDKRSALKRPKDYKQGMALLNVVSTSMPLYTLDDEFEASLPGELAGHYREWQDQRPSKTEPVWK